MMPSRIALVPDATMASHAQPSRSPNRASTAGATPVADMAAGTFPQGVGGRPTYLDGEEILPGAGSPLPYIGLFGSATVGLLTVGLWVTGLLAILTALLVAVCVLSTAIVMVAVLVTLERLFPNAGDRLAAVLDHETRDELRVRDELYRPGRLIEVSTVRPTHSCTDEAHREWMVDERYERSWDEPEF